MVRLEPHWSPLLQDGLMGCMQPLTNRWHGVVIVMVTRRRVVIVVVVYRLVGVIVLLLPKEVGVEVSVEVKMGLVISFHFIPNVLQSSSPLAHRDCVKSGHEPMKAYVQVLHFYILIMIMIITHSKFTRAMVQ